MAKKFLNTNMSIDGSEMVELAKEALGGNATAQALRAKDTYEQQVIAILDSIHRTQTGRAVFTEISRQGPHFNIEIKPYFIDPDREFEINKSKAALKDFPGTLTDYHNARIRQLEQEELAASPGGYAKPMGRPVGITDQLGRKGKREAALVRFTPAHWTYNPINVALGIGIPSSFGPSSQPDEVLLHELVHAQRYTAGLNNAKRNVPFQEKYDNREEWIAILIANIYHSECKREYRRSNHHSFWFKSADNETFLDEGMNRMHVRQLRRQQPLLFNALNDVSAAFNPLRGFRDGRA